MLSFIRIVIASLLVSFVYGISTPTTTTPHILARTNAEAFKRHERVLAPRTFKPTLDAHGRTRSLPIPKMNRAKRAQVSARTCPNFQNVDAFIVVTAQNGQNLGFVTAASE